MRYSTQMTLSITVSSAVMERHNAASRVFYCYAEYYYAEWHYAEWHYAECHYVEWHYAEWHYS